MKKKIQLIPLVTLVLSAAALSSALTSCQFGHVDSKAGDLSEVKTAKLYQPVSNESQTDPDYVTEEAAIVRYRTIDDIPYVSFSEALRMLIGEGTYVEDISNKTFTYTIPYEAGKSFTISIDPDKNTISFDDYSMLITILTGVKVPNNVVSMTSKDDMYVRLNKDKCTYTNGGTTTFDVGQSGLDIISNGDNVYLPFSVINSTFYESMSVPIVFNGDDFYMALSDMFIKPRLTQTAKAELSSFGKSYYTGAYSKTKTRTDAMIEYSYDTLCFNFNNFYGFHDKYENFDLNTYLNKNYPTIVTHLKSNDVQIYETGINELHRWAFGDGHTSTLYYSSFNGQLNNLTREKTQTSEREQKLFATQRELAQLRKETLGDSFSALSLASKTAIIRFDSYEHTGVKFTKENIADYSALDTFALFYNCFQEIQKHSEIENVIFDLSVNGGGAADALIASTGFLSRDIKLAIDSPTANTLSHAEVNYSIDTNLDGKFDENDSFAGKYNFFVLTSNFSFSCANLFPTLCRANGLAKMIGETSGGGACIVRSTVTADGMCTRMSNDQRLEYMKDGQLTDNDEGIVPDYEYARADYYDNAKLAAFVESK